LRDGHYRKERFFFERQGARHFCDPGARVMMMESAMPDAVFLPIDTPCKEALQLLNGNGRT